MGLFDKIKNIFKTVSITDCDASGQKILQTQSYKRLTDLLPEWDRIVKDGILTNEKEALRTLRHIFRSLKVYFLVLENEFETSYTKKNMQKLKDQLEQILEYHRDLFVLFLLFHDLGRPMNREWHTYESAEILYVILEEGRWNLDLEIKNMLLGIVRYHLIPGTILTGESNYSSAISLYCDPELSKIWIKKDLTILFFTILEVFTFIDISGYDYAQIQPSYFSYYNSIRKNLSRCFLSVKEKDFSERGPILFRLLSELDYSNLKWRISCALRIFQFADEKTPYDKRYFLNKVEKGLEANGSSWNEFATSIAKSHSLIQVKYGLGILMALAINGSFWKPISDKEKVSSKLFEFWQVCARKIEGYNPKHLSNETNIKNQPLLWNFVFILPRGWFFEGDIVNKIKSTKFFNDIEETEPIYDERTNSLILTIKPLEHS